MGGGGHLSSMGVAKEEGDVYRGSCSESGRTLPSRHALPSLLLPKESPALMETQAKGLAKTQSHRFQSAAANSSAVS